MNKVLILVMGLCLGTLIAQDCKKCDGDHQSISIFMPRSVTMNPIFELSMTDRTYDLCNHALLSVKPFYTQSHSSERIAKQFLPNGKSKISVNQLGEGDVNPVWLGLENVTTGAIYTSTLSMAPTRR